MNKTFIATILFLSVALSVSSQEKFQIDIQKDAATGRFNLKNFFFVHHIFADAFFMTELHEQLSYDDMNHILIEIKEGVTAQNKVTVTVPQKHSPSAQLVFLSKEHPEKGNYLVMMTNFNASSRRFEQEIDQEISLVRWYFIRDNKLIYRKDEYSETVENNKKERDAHELIDYYLFDDNAENDIKVKGLIDHLLASEESKIEQLYGRVYLGEYWQREGNLEKAEAAVIDLKNYFEREKEIPRAYELIVKMATTELAIMKRIK